MATGTTGAGYSGTPLWRKLGVKEGHRLALLDAPDDLPLADLPAGVELRRRLGGELDVVVVFTTRRADLVRRWPALLRGLVVDGGLWVAWPKRASGVATDMTEDVVREVALPTGMVDNKVCAIDATWSGLRCVLRKELRAGRTRVGDRPTPPPGP